MSLIDTPPPAQAAPLDSIWRLAPPVHPTARRIGSQLKRTGHHSRRLALLTILAAALPAGAQSRPDPLDPAAPVAPTPYQSVLGAPPALGRATVGSWHDANETVKRIGGWRTYAREATSTLPAGTPSPTAAPGSSPPASVAPPSGQSASSRGSTPAAAPRHSH